MGRPPLLCLLLFLALPLTYRVSAQETPPSAPLRAQSSAPPVSLPPSEAVPVTLSQTQQTQQTQQTKDKEGTYTIRRTARIVVLDVVVTDRKGALSTNLRREDFHVTESGAPQTILNFEVAGANTPDPGLTINSTADLDRLAPRAPVNIVLLDEFNTRFEDMAFARYSLKKYLEKQPGKLNAPTMLIAVDLQHFTVLQDYTQDKEPILSALDHHLVRFPWQIHQGQWLGERYAVAFQTLRRVAQAMIGHPGHKNMIWIGRGFPSINVMNGLNLDSDSLVENAVQECVNTLRDARVTLYTIDPAGVMVDPGEYGTGAAFADPLGGNYQFSRLAKATGGRTIYGRNDVDAQIGTAIRDGSSLFTLTYRPTNDSPELQKFRKIKVTIERPDLTATTREGYYLQLPPDKVNPINPSRQLRSDLFAADRSVMVYDGVPLTLRASKTNPDAFTVHVGGESLTWSFATDAEARQTELILMTSLFDKKGKELQRTAKNIFVKASGNVSPSGRLVRDVDINFKFAHDPKAVRARFVVRVAASGRIGTADAVLGQSDASVTVPR